MTLGTELITLDEMAGRDEDADAFDWACRTLRMAFLISLLVGDERMYVEDVLYGLNPYEIGLIV